MKKIKASKWDHKQVKVRSAGPGSEFMGGIWEVLYRLPSNGQGAFMLREELKGKYLVMNNGGGCRMYVTETELELA